MKIHKAARKYEAWLAKQCPLVTRDIDRKHALMRGSAFGFLRGTFYRWAQRFPEVCPDLARAPRVPAIGDLHVENFGTWRDTEGRLVWGINDFDECAPLSYANDLVRLATSAILAAREARLHLSVSAICRAILAGYRRSLAVAGMPFVLDGQHHWLHHAATAGEKPPAEFWQSLKALPPAGPSLSGGARKALLSALPAFATGVVFKRRTAGVGSLGRPRVVALASWRGGLIAREAKARACSAVFWADDDNRVRNYSASTLAAAVRPSDPTLHYARRWIVRRLAPDCVRIELADLPSERDEGRLLAAMGAEAANVHLGDPAAAARAERHVRTLRVSRLATAATRMADAVTDDWRAFKAPGVG